MKALCIILGIAATAGGFDDHKNKLRIYGGIFK